MAGRPAIRPFNRRCRCPNPTSSPRVDPGIHGPTRKNGIRNRWPSIGRAARSRNRIELQGLAQFAAQQRHHRHLTIRTPCPGFVLSLSFAARVLLLTDQDQPRAGGISARSSHVPRVPLRTWPTGGRSGSGHLDNLAGILKSRRVGHSRSKRDRDRLHDIMRLDPEAFSVWTLGLWTSEDLELAVLAAARSQRGHDTESLRLS